MSRSYKKVFGYVDRNPWSKKQANKKVRRTENISSGGSYKKVHESYDICDYTFIYFNKSDVNKRDKPWKYYSK
jgi:hypothetical protein